MVGGSLHIQGQKIKKGANGEIVYNADGSFATDSGEGLGGDISITNMKEIHKTYESRISKTSKSWFGIGYGGSHRVDTKKEVISKVIKSQIHANNDLSITSSGNLNIIGSDITSNTGDINLFAEGDILIAAAKQTELREEFHKFEEFKLNEGGDT